MASTYSSLKIQLMATGENSGTWGNITNINLGTAIEEAITGSADVTFSSGPVTLTLVDANSSQTARNLRLNLTGTSGGAQNLIVPAIEKVYIVNNGCADTITVKNTTGTGIAVPAGKTMYVYNNGTNVVDAVTHLTSLTLSTPLANNQTTASASNGASTIVARDASGNFAANVVTATTFSGSGASLTNIPNSATTAASANGASTIVARDASGNFAANTATLTTVTGAGSGLTSLNASNISSGTVATGRLATGTANNTTFLRGDSTWQAIVAGGGLTNNVRQAVTSSATTTININSGNVVDLTMAANITTLAFSNVPASGTPLQLVIVFRNAADGSNYQVTWPSSIYWNSTAGAPGTLIGPTLTGGANTITIISLLTTDGGTKWRGWVEADIPGQATGNNLYAWGSNSAGQLGQNNIVNRSSPVQVGFDTGWAQLKTGTASGGMISIKADGTMWAWGANGSGVLGLGDGVNRSSPVQVGTDTNWAKVALNSDTSVAIKTTGTLWAWGRNEHGQLGQNNLISRSSPVQIGAATDWAEVASGGEFCGAIKTTGTLWAWGQNSFYGQLGQNDRINRSSPVQIGSDSNWSKLSAGVSNFMAIKTTGSLWSWGYNGLGQLGQGNIAPRSSPVQVGSNTNWAKVTAGSRQGSAITTAGTLFTWGFNASGCLGIGNQDNKSSPTQVGSDTNWSQIAITAYQVVALRTTGSIWSWGYNTSGQLGLNLNTSNYSSRSSPVQIGSDTNWSQVGMASATSFALKTAPAINPA